MIKKLKEDWGGWEQGIKQTPVKQSPSIVERSIPSTPPVIKSQYKERGHFDAYGFYHIGDGGFYDKNGKKFDASGKNPDGSYYDKKWVYHLPTSKRVYRKEKETNISERFNSDTKSVNVPDRVALFPKTFERKIREIDSEERSSEKTSSKQEIEPPVI